MTEEEICNIPMKSILVDGYRTKTGEKDAQKIQAASSTLYRVAKPEAREKVKIKYIPYYMWANRKENEMQVWTKRSQAAI